MGFHEANTESIWARFGARSQTCGENKGAAGFGENLPPNDRDWGNLTIASQEINPDLIIVSTSEHYGPSGYAIIAK